jgi:hypothetical protein
VSHGDQAVERCDDASVIERRLDLRDGGLGLRQRRTLCGDPLLARPTLQYL